ncbi:hypothetical protein [Roseovarius nanhaiticus]|uniref:hypothetical protein n=1 Tax=Roseovarius nanhaiticus TaxID=573024 RepID=UPI00249358A8|nr:hypothetical protein [Roseovarius nanhaiticus]
MRNLALSALLIAVPVAGFSAVYSITATPAPQSAAAVAAPSLGDMTPFATITSEVQSIVSAGALKAAEVRITDLETAWDDAQKTMRPRNTAAWGHVDGAIDTALSALRAKSPDAAAATAALAALQVALANPSEGVSAPTGIHQVSGVDVTDATGRPLPCEVMLDNFKTARASATVAAADQATIDTLQARGTERCNADDDTRAGEFFAQGIALMRK